jgi:hypothetical protein
MSNFENSQALENQLFDLIAIHYPTNFSNFLGACAFIKQKGSEAPLCYQSSLAVALIVCRMRLDFSFVLSCTFYKSINLRIVNLNECILIVFVVREHKAQFSTCFEMKFVNHVATYVLFRE